MLTVLHRSHATLKENLPNLCGGINISPVRTMDPIQIVLLPFTIFKAGKEWTLDGWFSPSLQITTSFSIKY
jgi:hypothetical protein